MSYYSDFIIEGSDLVPEFEKRRENLELELCF